MKVTSSGDYAARKKLKQQLKWDLFLLLLNKI